MPGNKLRAKVKPSAEGGLFAIAKIYLAKRVFFIIFARVSNIFQTMNTKLTLTMERAVIEKAKSYAKKQGRSLSDIIENYLKVVTAGQGTSEELSPLVKSLRGSFKAPASFDYKEELKKGLAEKYLK